MEWLRFREESADQRPRRQAVGEGPCHGIGSRALRREILKGQRMVFSGRCLPLIAMLKTTDLRKCHDRGGRGWLHRRDTPFRGFRGVLADTQMAARPVVVADER